MFNLHCLLFQSQNAELRSAYCRLWPDIPTPSGSRRRRLVSDKKNNNREVRFLLFSPPPFKRITIHFLKDSLGASIE